MKIQIRTTILAALLLGFSTVAAAQSREAIDVASLGPQIGERVPDFNLPDQNPDRSTTWIQSWDQTE